MPHPDIDLPSCTITIKVRGLETTRKKWGRHWDTVQAWLPASLTAFKFGQIAEIVDMIRNNPWTHDHRYLDTTTTPASIFLIQLHSPEIDAQREKESQSPIDGDRRGQDNFLRH